jgi:hypothetical protein
VNARRSQACVHVVSQLNPVEASARVREGEDRERIADVVQSESRAGVTDARAGAKECKLTGESLEESESAETQSIKRRSNPAQPSREEEEQHATTHLPYRT